MSVHDSPPNEKAEVAQDEFGVGKVVDSPDHGRHGHNKTKEEIERLDALALASGTTIESFQHLDEKKILRKVCHPSSVPSARPAYVLLTPSQMDLRLIPVLALLYLLSFLDS